MSDEPPPRRLRMISVPITPEEARAIRAAEVRELECRLAEKKAEPLATSRIAFELLMPGDPGYEGAFFSEHLVRGPTYRRNAETGEYERVEEPEP